MWKWLRWALPPLLQDDVKAGAFYERGLKVDKLKANCRPECLHLNAYIREIDPFGTVYCPDCDCLTRVSIWLNNLADKVRRDPSL